MSFVSSGVKFDGVNELVDVVSYTGAGILLISSVTSNVYSVSYTLARPSHYVGWSWQHTKH